MEQQGEMPLQNSNEFEKNFQYFYDNCVISKQKIYIGKFLMNNPWLFNGLKNCRVVIVEALFHSAAVNLHKITYKKEELNILSFGRQCLSEELYQEFECLKPKDADLKSLKNRRNKSLAHSDKENIKVDISKEYPLYIETLDRIAEAVEEMLEFIARNKKGVSFGGTNKKTGKHESLIDFQVKRECEAAIFSGKKLFEIQNYMRKKHPNELLSILYSKEGNNDDGQAENAHVE